MDTSHVLSFVFSIPAISLAAVPQDPVTPQQIPSGPLAISQVYDPSAVLPQMRLHDCGYPSRFPMEEDGIRVWSIDQKLEESLISFEEPERKRQRLEEEKVDLLEKDGRQDEGGEDEDEDEGGEDEDEDGDEREREEPEEITLEVLARKIKKPLGFQKTGPIVWVDPEPQSSRAAHPWIISQERETRENVTEMFRKIIDPQVEERRSYMLVGSDVERRTTRKTGWGAGQHNDQLRVEDLSKPILLVSMPCGHVVSISTDIALKGLDTKMARVDCGRTGAFCYLCRTPRKSAHSVNVVKSGFFCDMSAEELLTHVEDWLGPEICREEWDQYEFVSERGDESVRFGVKRAPLSSVIDVVNTYAVLHTGQLRLFGWMEQLFLRLSSNCPWGVGNLGEPARKRKEAAEEEWKGEKLGPLLGFRHLKAPNQVTRNWNFIQISGSKIFTLSFISRI